MPLTPGTRLGPYEIASPLGAGGMGEVYRAKDTRLDRDVAVKVLPEAFANNELLRARFDREAKSISSLNHPNICTLFDVGHQEGLLYLVMEMIDGETLADRLSKGALPPDQVLRFGAQIADALDHAHKQGIVHRDLKPGNVMLTKSGAKLLDFGLARTAAEAQSPVQGLTSHPTQMQPLTQEGTILGTFQYMAPEQLEGTGIDARTDIFALGAVLYEMVTGKRAFEGKTKTSLIAAVVSSQPAPISTVVPLAPPALDHVVKRCLEKDPDDRWHSAHDVAGELRWISQAGSSAGVAAPVTLRRKSREKIAWTLAALMTIAALAAVTMRREGGASRPEAPGVVRSMLPISSEELGGESYRTVAVSPDGKTVAWLEVRKGSSLIYLRRLSDPEAHPLAGTEHSQQLFFSPDSKWLGFFAGGRMKKVSVAGGAPVAIARGVLPRGASWADDDSILFVPFFYGGVERVSASGGNRETLTTLDRANGEVAHRWPHALPGGKAFLYTIGRGSSWDEAQIAAQRIGSKERKIVIEGGYDGRYLPTGHLVYARGASLYAVRFDLEKLEVAGDPVQLVEGVAHGDAGASEYAFSNDGVLSYRPAGITGGDRSPLALVDRSGRSLPFRDPAPAGRDLSAPLLSRSGESLVVTIGYEIWAFDLPRGTSTRLTSGTRATLPIWSPDGKFVTYGEERHGPWNPYIRRADGSEPEQLLMKSDASLYATSWSPDGRSMLMIRVDPETGNDLLILSVADKKMTPFVVTEHSEDTGTFSPDGKWIAYASDESERPEIYVRPFGGAEGRWQISTEGAISAHWKKQDEIVFQSGRKVMSVHVRTSPTFSADPPRLLFEGPHELLDVMPDGDRFLVREVATSDRGDSFLRLVTGWFAEVAEKTRR
ncbi:MAG: serine/threonine-protein kinase [Acidobacteria bacterium]|nr:serine/threonine-protein kinase [Acidobacteriota bacterium]